MYHVKFLKAPSFSIEDVTSSKPGKQQKQSKKPSSNSRSSKFSISNPIINPHHRITFNTLITVSNDLGEEFFYGDVRLKCSLIIGHTMSTNNGDTPVEKIAVDIYKSGFNLTETMFGWTRGARALPISISIPMAELKKYAGGHGKKLYAVLKIEHEDKTEVVDALNKTLKDSINLANGSVAGVLPTASSDIDLILHSNETQFLAAISFPMTICDATGVYHLDSGIVSTERYCLRAFDLAKLSRNLHDAPSASGVLKYDENDSTIFLLEELGNGIERHVWNAGIYLPMVLPFILDKTNLLIGNSTTKKIRALELGTGIGVVSIALAKLLQHISAISIEATDLEEAEEICVKNTDLNQPVAKMVQFHELEWTGIDSYGQEDQHCDWIFAADCTYNPTYYPDMINVLQRETTLNTIVTIAHKLREPIGEMEFFRNLQTKFNMIGGYWIHTLHESVFIGHYMKKKCENK